MSGKKRENKKVKRKIKQKERRQRPARALLLEKVGFLLDEALWAQEEGHPEKALFHLEKALRLDPKNEECLLEMGYIGQLMKRPDVEVSALLGLYNNDLIKPDQIPYLCRLLQESGRYEQVLVIIRQTLKGILKIKPDERNALKDYLIQMRKYCLAMLEMKEKQAAPEKPARKPEKRDKPKRSGASAPLARDDTENRLPEIPIHINADPEAFRKPLAPGRAFSMEHYHLAIEGYRIRFKETFESLICLSSLKDVKSFWFQEETARKILKTFHGRALLADEVGLGKTIEACMVLKEYIQRGMVKNALILAPTPLVSQWKGELKDKFGLDFPSSDDPGSSSRSSSLWKQDFILASINLAKSKKNFPMVSQREYDMVIVDEAHHLKNRNTLNWKLINSLKKKFLLLLTATPVENNLMELYNIVTLLKPGQLKTASAFRQEFMTRGDPTDPQNRSRLKDLLGQVMIRNTRAFARIDIPPRFARTVKVSPGPAEIELYQKINTLIKAVSMADKGAGHRLLLKNLLAEAGSSPLAVKMTLSRIFEKKVMLPGQEDILHSIDDLCNSIKTTSKDKFLLDLLRSNPGKMILFVKYRGTLDHLSGFLREKGIAHSLFHGSMDNRTKDDQIRSFEEERDILLTTEIGGEGRNLQFCHQMVNYDLPWNPMKIEQRIGRIHRIGQKHEVSIYNLCAAGSIEDYILEILDRKINMFELVIGEIDMILGRLKEEKDFSETVYDIWIDALSDEERKKAFGHLGRRLARARNGYQKSRELDEKLFGENYEL